MSPDEIPEFPARPLRDDDDDAVEMIASEWLALCEERSLSDPERAAFETWVAASPRHAKALEELSNAWRTFDQLRAYPRPAGTPDDPNFFKRPRAFRHRVVVISAAVAALALAFVWWVTPARQTSLPQSLAAAVTPQIVHLTDGSEIELKAGSEITTTFTAAERHVRLIRGEAHFSVAKDAARPFIVEVTGIAVRAVGTAFNVRLDPVSVEVLVTEGTVRVAPRNDDLAGIEPLATLHAGQLTSVAVTPTNEEPKPAIRSLSPPEIDRALAWQTSRLVFDATPLGDVVAAFNRHNLRQIVLRDPTLGTLPVSGRFRAGNVDGFLELLESGFGVAVERTPEEVRIRRKAL